MRKICPKCHQNRLFNGKNLNGKFCNLCSNPDANQRGNRVNRSKERSHALSLMYLYGLTVDGYNKLLKKQKGKCFICQQKPSNKKLCVDHDHETGEVRGLLCDKCNRGLGLFDDSVERLQRAVEYLCS
jgi:hypothetical protein